LRENVYRILDEVLDTGIPIEINRRGKKLKIVRAEGSESSWLDHLPERPEVIEGDPEGLVHMDWSKEWRPGPT